MECDTPLLRRRNGRPQACDPCRARKVACDHGQPTCSRCRKRKETCVYTVSEPRIKGPRIQRPTPPTRSGTSTPSPSAPGYLGFTSHNAVFEETRNSLSLVHGSTLDIESAARRGPRVRACLIEMPSSLREMCLFVLRNLPGPSDDVLSYRFHCRADHWIIASVKATLRSLQESFGEHLANREDTLKLEEMGLTICNNTARPLRDEYPTGQDWLDQFGCSALRWESLGLIWTYWDGSPNANPRTIATSLGYCIELARHFSIVNDLLVYLCYRRATIESLITGDAGLHVGSENADYVPSLRLESKRRLAARIFTIDKVMVSFTGRPPLIGRRYFSTPLPLDIRDEDLLADQATISRVRKTLDEDGWNRDGDMHSATLIRARVQIAVIKDELLEFALEDSSKATLESLSFEMVTLTLIFWTQQDRFAEVRRDFEWLKLSLLIGFLDWVRPPAPNADLCADCKAVIQGVLDHNLNAPLAGGGALETLDWGMPMQLDFNFDLLDTFDWLRAE
ncbi:hypothetical protein BFJ68_g17257 [Fusarium oxysporum]|uniref:Zn(2)-C6 fungal-type domain-containing protein n=1 Tax=Fusarium oxysporum TaxID=5507 RepID=A0A420NZ54_FUSOX|nr:hypothetical protein BFJ68_g17257 [Fusarium oxysporum]